MPMHAAMNEAAHQPPIEPVDIQRLLVWYFESVDPDRPHIRHRGWDTVRAAVAGSAGL